MQEIISILKTLAESNTVNFIIMAIILGVIIKKMNTTSMLEKSSDTIRNNIEKSERSKRKSHETLAESQKQMDRLPQDIAALESTSESKIKAFEDKIKSNTKKTISDINQSINRAMEIEEKKISNLITEKTSKDSITSAKNKIIDILNQNPDLHNQFIQQSLDELDKVQI